MNLRLFPKGFTQMRPWKIAEIIGVSSVWGRLEGLYTLNRVNESSIYALIAKRIHMYAALLSGHCDGWSAFFHESQQLWCQCIVGSYSTQFSGEILVKKHALDLLYFSWQLRQTKWVTFLHRSLRSYWKELKKWPCGHGTIVQPYHVPCGYSSSTTSGILTGEYVNEEMHHFCSENVSLQFKVKVQHACSTCVRWPPAHPSELNSLSHNAFNCASWNSLARFVWN